MTEEKRMTAPETSVGADEGQSTISKTIDNISDYDDDFNENFFCDPYHLNTISMNELYDTVYESRPPLIDGFLYPGTYLFVGAPKLGKSFLMAQIAYHVSTGTKLWDFPVRKGTVLYLALEDDYHRLQKRMYQMFGIESTEDLHFAVNAESLGNGLDKQLENFLWDHPKTSLIIIDTLQKVREVSGDNYSYANDYEIITKLKNFADEHRLCLILVHHTRKQQSSDKFDMISGTNGLLGAADGAFLLRKEKRTSNSAVLEVSGRDQQDQKLHLTRNTDRLLWELQKVETELWKEPPEPLLDQIAQFINAENPDWSGTATEFVEALKLDIASNKLTCKLNVNAGKLKSEYHIRYTSKRGHNGRSISFHYEKRDDA
ncbi:MAG: helicase RepA family protein [Clostridia bacterium]|nr:helicase RepA family protein [Clostridia bacterium]